MAQRKSIKASAAGIDKKKPTPNSGGYAVERDDRARRVEVVITIT